MSESEDIYWHDCKIGRVLELPRDGVLVFEVTYPVDWDKNLFEPRAIVFINIAYYEVKEGPFAGCPTILEAERETTREGKWRYSLETNAGTRIIECDRVELREEYTEQPH